MADEVIKILDELGKRFGLAIDWSSQNIIPYLQQLLHKIVNYELVTSIVWLFILNIPFLILFIVYKGYKKSNYIDNIMDCDTEVALMFVLMAVLSVTCSIFSIKQIFDIITCFTFPEKIIIDFITHNNLQ